MAGPDFHYPQRRRARRRRKPARSRRMVGSNLWLTPVMAVAFYNHPRADDYTYGAVLRKVIDAGQGLPEVRVQQRGPEVQQRGWPADPPRRALRRAQVLRCCVLQPRGRPGVRGSFAKP